MIQEGRCYIVAEIGINHNGDIGTAKQLIKAAKDAGCDAVKFQKRTIDVVYTAGYGFPRYRGGPMYYADTVGLKKIYDRILDFQRTLDPQYWQPSALLEKLANAGSTFTQWQAEQGR